MRIVHLFSFTANILGLSDKQVAREEMWGFTEALKRLNKNSRFQNGVHFFSNDEKEKKYCFHQNLPYHFHPVSSSFSLRAISVLLHQRFSSSFFEFLKKNVPDIVHFHANAGFQNYMIAWWLSRQKIPYIVHFHVRDTMDKFSLRSLLRYFQGNIRGMISFSIDAFFRTRFLRKARAFVAGTELEKTAICRKYHVLPSWVYVIPMGVNVQLFKPDLLISRNTSYPKLLFVGRVYPDKGVYDVVKCVDYLRAHFFQPQLTIAGALQDLRYVSEIRSYIKRNNLDEMVKWTGHISHHELTRVYNEADIFVFPSRSEGAPVSIMEAMACEKPVVALRNSGGSDEIIDDGINGVLTILEGLNKTVLGLVRNRNKMKALGKNARRKVIENYSSEHTYTGLRSLYEAIGHNNKIQTDYH